MPGVSDNLYYVGLVQLLKGGRGVSSIGGLEEGMEV